MSMRGLTVFIADLRACRGREEEQKRINKELVNIRQKFKDPKLPGLKKKKYICKLIYMYILGWPLDFGFQESVKLISSPVYSEKQIGYLAASIILNEDSDLIKAVITNISTDLDDMQETVSCLALNTIANICSRDIVDSLAPQVIHVLLRSRSPFIQKKAALTVLRMYRRFPQQVQVNDYATEFLPLILSADYSVCLCILTLIHFCAIQYRADFAPGIYSVVELLTNLYSGNVPKGYFYYDVLLPWLQVRIFRFLQLYDLTLDLELLEKLNGILELIISSFKNDKSAPVQQKNASIAIFIEATNLAIHIDPSSTLVAEASVMLASFISSKETNLRYLGLDIMAKLANHEGSIEAVNSQLDLVLSLLTDRDVSVRKRTLDVLFACCNIDNAKIIVGELLKYLGHSDYQLRDELVLRIAILTERFATDYDWYVDVILQLITAAGDTVTSDVWYRVIQIVSIYPDIQKYATRTLFESLKEATCHESTVKVGGYILGEYGPLIVDEPGCSAEEQYEVLSNKFLVCNVDTRSMLLTSYLKMANNYNQLKEEICEIFKQYRLALDSELQQRACEYYELVNNPDDTLLKVTCQSIPPFSGKSNSLLSLLRKNFGDIISENDNEKLVDSKQKSLIPIAPNELAILAPKGKTITDKDDQLNKNINSKNKNNNLTNLDIINRPPSPSRTDSLPSPIKGLFSVNLTYDANNPQPIVDLNQQYNKLLISTSGVIYEDEFLQIGIKSEFSGENGVIQLFFGNKTPNSFEDSKCEIILPTGDIFPLGEIGEQQYGLKMTNLSTIPDFISGGTQHIQAYSIVCCNLFDYLLRIRVKYTISQVINTDGVGNIEPRRVIGPIFINLPLTITKFIAAVEQKPEQFSERWKQIGGPPRELEFVQAAINRNNLTKDRIKACFLGCGFWSIEGPNIENDVFVGSGILSSSLIGKVGCLLRLEINESMGMYKCTIRTTNDQVTKIVSNNIQMILSRTI